MSTNRTMGFAAKGQVTPLLQRPISCWGAFYWLLITSAALVGGVIGQGVVFDAVCWMLAAGCVNMWCAQTIMRRRYRYVSLLALVSNFAIQPFIVCILAITGFFASSENGAFGDLLSERGHIAFLAIITVPAVAMLASVAFDRKVENGRLLLPVSSERPILRVAVLNILGVFTLFGWLSEIIDQPFTKAMMTLFHRAFLLAPFVAAFHRRGSNVVLFFWVVIMGVNLVFSLLSGSRLWGFMPIVLFWLGSVGGAHPKDRRRWLIAGLFSLLVILPLIGWTQQMRDTVGRVTLSEAFRGGRVSEVRSVARQTSPASSAEISSSVLGLSRLVTWPNLVVPMMSGTDVAHFGVLDIPRELADLINVSALTGRVSERDAGIYNFKAAAFGFRVDEFTSVEFGLLPDSWSRAGWWMTVVYAFIASVILILMELAIRNVLIGYPLIASVVLAAICAGALWQMNVFYLPLAVRQTIFNILAIVPFGLTVIIVDRAIRLPR